MKPPMDHKVKRPQGPWVPAQDTDVRRTWERVRREQDEKAPKCIDIRKGKR